MMQKAKTLGIGLVLEDGSWGQYTITKVETYKGYDGQGREYESVLVWAKQGKIKRSWTFGADQEVYTVG
jgi:hypothetical protein